MVVRSPYLHNGISHTGNMTSLYGIGALLIYNIPVSAPEGLDEGHNILSYFIKWQQTYKYSIDTQLNIIITHKYF